MVISINNVNKSALELIYLCKCVSLNECWHFVWVSSLSEWGKHVSLEQKRLIVSIIVVTQPSTHENPWNWMMHRRKHTLVREKAGSFVELVDWEKK